MGRAGDKPGTTGQAKASQQANSQMAAAMVTRKAVKLLTQCGIG